MTKDWDVKTIGEVCEVVGGGTPKTVVPEFWSDDIVWVTPKDLGKLDTVEIFDTNKHISHKGLKKSSAKLLPAGSVVMSSRAPIGYVAIAGVELATNQGCRNFVCGDKIHNKYLYYFLFANTALLNSLGEGATFREISGTTIKGINIPLPPIIEQKRLVKILDDKFESIEKLKSVAKQQLTNAQELFNSRLNEVFSGSNKSFELKHLSEVSEYFNGLTYSPSDQSNEGVIVLRSSNVQNDHLDYSDIVRVTCKIPEKKIVREGDILMCSRNGSKRLVGKTATITNLEEEMTFGTFMMIIRSDYNEYLGWFFKSPEFRKQITQGENTMINQITRYMLDEVVVNFPPTEEQKKIVKEFNELSQKTKELEVVFRRKISELEELKKSYLHEAFSGNL